MSDLSVAVLQLTSGEDVLSNQKHVMGLLSQLQDSVPVDIIFLPENSLFIRVDSSRNHIGIEVTDSVYEPFKSFCKHHGCHMLFGSNPVKTQNGVENATIWVDQDGRVSKPYTKIHLFDVEVDGHKPVRESDDFFSGSQPSVIDIRGWRIGLSICYDLRFSELYTHYAREAVDLICAPAAFLQKTGEAHWEVLQRARAIESQCYVLSAAQTGTHRASTGEARKSYGHSLIVDPWGLVEADMGTDVGVYQSTLSKSKIELVRSQIPMSKHRKL